MTEPAAQRPDTTTDPLDPEPQVDEATVSALGKLVEAVEMTERARGHLYSFHQLTGYADLAVGEAAALLGAAGHAELAGRLDREMVGRDVLPGRWTYQVVEEYEDCYYLPFRDLERQVRDRLANGRRHLPEALAKRQRRTPGEPGHEVGPTTTPEGGHRAV
ncbi:hypothetical protein CFN78_14770 [Amycolatopsis antarctica]|uniref:Uncharacterized protein n=1 Tax=Amycolatopsis antarctica TaxID=1854586 RepID=A0A263D1F4_9PSEU|nr:hypothetical protein [Amycolatopsis antarctica]OZM72280.1 hypothetical protein CFN78_14770 [Amycolatopsis antarctica]